MNTDIHALSGAYAVGAVDDSEREEFERHLEGCAECREEVAGFCETAALLAELSSTSPRPQVRAEVLAGADSMRRLPPVVSNLSAHRSRLRRWPAMIAAAAALVLIGAVGATVWNPWTQSESETPTATPAQLVTDAADAASYSVEARGGGEVTVIRSASMNQAVLRASGLSKLPDQLAYQLWLIHDDRGPVMAGLIDGDASWVLLEGDAATASAAAISIEPRTGSETPTRLYAEIPFAEA